MCVCVFFTCGLVRTASRSLTDRLSIYCICVCLCVCVCVCVCVCGCTHLSPAFFLSLHQSTVPQPTFSMPVTVPVSNQNAAAAAALQFSNNPGGALVTTTSFVTSTLTDPRLLSPQQPALQRNTVSPGLPQRPASAGKRHSWTAVVETLSVQLHSMFVLVQINILWHFHRNKSPV